MVNLRKMTFAYLQSRYRYSPQISRHLELSFICKWRSHRDITEGLYVDGHPNSHARSHPSNLFDLNHVQMTNNMCITRHEGWMVPL